MLNLYPLLLLVAGEDQVIFELRSDKSLVVVGCRVYEVADDLFGRPLSGRGARTSL